MAIQACVISCIFGYGFKKVYQAPSKHCFFYTNNIELKDEIMQKGWNFRYVGYELPLINNIITSSLQAKIIKFLQWDKLPILKEDVFTFERVLYMDHKLRVLPEHITFYEKHLVATAPIVIRDTPRKKTNVWQEYQDAMNQPRYSKFEKETHNYILQMTNGDVKEECRICATGLIWYDNKNPVVREIFDTVYQHMTQVGSPECQIFWCLVTQMCDAFREAVYIIPFEGFISPPILWKSP